MNYRPGLALWSAILIAGGLSAPQAVSAHYCSNIWDAPARLVVKPEKSTVYLSSAPTKLRVYLQNNFPMKLYGVQMRGQASGYTIMVSPSSQDVQPSQNVSFVVTVTKSGGGASVPVSTLNLQVKWRPGQYPYGWHTGSSLLVDQNPSQSTLKSEVIYTGQNQEPSLNAAVMASKYPNASLGSGAPFFGRTGMQQLVHWFGYRFCYTSSGSWRCGGGTQCPSPCAEGNTWNGTNQFPQNCIRAGVELARFHAQAKLGSQLSPARAAATNALKRNGSTMHKCMAAVVGAYLHLNASSGSFTSALNDGANGVPTRCRNAANRILTGSPSSSCTSGSSTERAACAAAEGLRGNDGPVTSVLMANAGDGYQPGSGNYASLYYAYMLYIVTAHRRAKAGKVSFYPDAGGPLAAGDGGAYPDTQPWPKCGDGKINGSDQCDGAALGGKNCQSLGFAGGSLSCHGNCTFNTAGCYKCGDGKINGSDQCDGGALGGKTCQSLGFTGGTLACNSNCTLNSAGCYRCGDGKLNGAEKCDGAALGGKTCKSLGYGSGTLKCNANCTLNASGCTKCGNNKVQLPEQCDGTDLNGHTCKTQGFTSGTLKCTAKCTFDKSACSSPGCGDGKINGKEQCDGAALAGKTCQSQGFVGGTLKCAKNCTFDTASCFKCGDDKINGKEQCDGKALGGKTCKAMGFAGGVMACSKSCTFDASGCFKCGDNKINGADQCDGKALGGKTCKALGYVGGTLACKAGCTFDTSKCTNCGNGKLDGKEACDGAALGGKTCKALGFVGGTLACKPGCTFDTSKCSGAGCGDGKINGQEKCDGKALGGKTCEALGFAGGGTLACQQDCKYDTSGCKSVKPDSGVNPPPDKGTKPQPDQGTKPQADAAVTPVPEPDNGCGVAQGRQRSPYSALTLISLLCAALWLRRRRQRD